MAHPMADWAARVMQQMDDYIVAVKKLWYHHCEESEIPQVSLDDLGAVLKADPRFHYLEELPEPDDWKDEEEDDTRMERMGYFRGPRVMLQSRIPTKEQLIEAIAKNIDRMMLNLRKAYEIRPRGDESTEDELINVMLRADQLKKEIIRAVGKEPATETNEPPTKGKDQTPRSPQP